MTAHKLVRFPEERRLAVEHIENLRALRVFVELVDDRDLAPFRDPLVRDDLLAITAVLESAERDR
jgi:hypothetical protein